MQENHSDIKKTELEAKSPPVLFDSTQEIIRQIEEISGKRLLSYWTSHSGGVCQNDVIALYEILDNMDAEGELVLFIKSQGGDVEAALRIVHLIRERFSFVTALIVLECASAATMIALGADKIQMGPMAYLTAIDSSLRHALSPIDNTNSRVSVSQDELSRIVKLWENTSNEHHANPYSELFKYVHPMVVGALDRSSSLSVKICKEILSYHLSDDDLANRISQALNSNYPSHGYPITSKEAKSLGLEVDKMDERLNELLLRLNEHYSEMAQQAVTDYDEFNHHDNEILNIIEGRDIQIYYQNDKDWHYIQEERRWRTLNDDSSWRKIVRSNGEKKFSKLHMR